MIAFYIAIIIGLGLFFLLYADNLSLIVLIAAVLLPFAMLPMTLAVKRRLRITLPAAVIKCEKGSEAEVMAGFDNPSRFPVSSMKVEIVIKFYPGGTEEKHTVAVPLGAGSSREIGIKIRSVTCRRAVCRISRVTVYDYLNIFRFRKRDAENVSAAVDFLPSGEVRLDPVIAERLSVKESIGGEADFNSAANDNDPDELRPYRDGDKLNRIAWKLSGKGNDDIIVRSSSLRREAVYLLVSDILTAEDEKAADGIYELFYTAARTMYDHEISFDSVKSDGSILKNVYAEDRLDQCLFCVYGENVDIDTICENRKNRRYDKIVLVTAAGERSAERAQQLCLAFGARDSIIINVGAKELN